MSRFPFLASLCPALVGLTISVLLISNAVLGVIPDDTQQASLARAALSKSLAVQYSLLVSRREEATITASMRALVDRNSDILSAALLTRDGRTVAIAGDHAGHWTQPADNGSTPTHIQAPIYEGEAPWGTLQLSFREIRPFAEGWLPMSPSGSALLLVACLGFVGYFLLLKFALARLPSSQAAPTRVHAAFTSLTDGVVITDPKGAIMLFNESFKRMTDHNSDVVLGSSLDQLPWVQAEGVLSSFDNVTEVERLRKDSPNTIISATQGRSMPARAA